MEEIKGDTELTSEEPSLMEKALLHVPLHHLVLAWRKFKLKLAASIVLRARRRKYACITIQKHYRRLLGKRRFDRYQVVRYREKIQERYSSTEGLYKYYFEQNGAAKKIQNWFRNLVWRRKRIFRKKYAKLLKAKEEYVAERKRLRMEYLKSQEKGSIIGNISGSNEDDKFIIDAVNCINSRVRGILTRIKYKEKVRRHNAVKIIQALSRGYIVRNYRLPAVGTRCRSHLIRRRKWSSNAISKLISDNYKLNTVYSMSDMFGSLLASSKLIMSSKSAKIDPYRPMAKKVTPLMLPADYPLSTIALRRSGVLFHNFKVASAWQIRKMDKAVRKIRRAWKTYKVNSAFSVLFERRHIILVLRIQHWYITWKRRHLVLESLKVIQPKWRVSIRRYFRRCKAALKVQTMYRRHLGIKVLRHLKWYRVRGIHIIQGWFLRRKAFRNFYKKLCDKRAVSEQLLAGEQLFERSVLFKTIDNLYSGSKKVKNIDVQHEMQRFFMTLTQQQSQMDSSRVIKLMKDCKIIEDKKAKGEKSDKVGEKSEKIGEKSEKLDEKAIELLFSKAKLAADKRLSYPNFLVFLENMGAIMFLNIDPQEIKAYVGEDGSGNSVAASAAVESTEDLPPPPATDSPSFITRKGLLSANDLILSFRYGRYTGKAALRMKFVFTYLLPLPDMQKVVSSLKQKGANALAIKLIMEICKQLQRWVRHCLNMKRMKSKSNFKIEEKIKELKNIAAKKIQGMMRGFIGRRQLMRMAQILYCKYIDPDSQMPYWYNSRTKASFWKKPRLLGKLDCGIPILMPSDAEMYDVPCTVCITESAVFFCDECDDSMCGMCFTKVHRRGVRAKHTKLDLTLCIQCDFQAGTKGCIQCKDSYCDNCFKIMHKKGRLRLHIFHWQVDACMSCQDRAAKWSLYDSYTGHYNLICGVCYLESSGGVPPRPSKECKRVKFQGKQVMEYRAEKEKNYYKALTSEQYALKQVELNKKKREYNATAIQRVYRGYKKRQALAPFLLERKAFYQLRLSEMEVRESVHHQILALFGVAPILKSDYTMERMKKQFPSYMHHIVGECINNNWSYACEVFKQEEAYKAKLHKLNAATKITSNLTYKKALSDFEGMKRAYDQAHHAHEEARILYREHRSKMSKVPTAAQKKRLDELTLAMEEKKRMEMKADERMKQKEEKFIAAKKEMDSLLPPKKITEIIQEIRRTGVLLPFTISAYTGSRSVLTKFPNAAVDAQAAPVAPSGNWKKTVSFGDVILLNGIEYTVVDKAIEDEMQRLEEEDKAKSKLEKAEQRGDDADSDDSMGVDEDEEEGVNDAVATRRTIEHTDEHIYLDRPWLLHDAEDLVVFKRVSRVFFARPIFALLQFIHRTYPVQKAIAVAAITVNQMGWAKRKAATMFDDDSVTYANLLRDAAQYEGYSQQVLKYSVKPVDTSTWDFTLRRKVSNAILRTMNCIVKLCKMCGSIAVKYSKLEVDPYLEWEDRKDKVDIACDLEMEVDSPVQIGEFKMCLDAPVDVMRIYVARNFRDYLNSKANLGEGFLFYSGAEDLLLPRELELTRYSKDFCPFIINNKTMNGVNRVVLRPDPDSATHKAIMPFTDFFPSDSAPKK